MQLDEFLADLEGDLNGMRRQLELVTQMHNEKLRDLAQELQGLKARIAARRGATPVKT
jgi:hypothetical protein